MTQEDKQLLLKDLCARLPYGVKILYNGWDSDGGCEFSTVETLIGIDDRFIYTLWRDEKDKHSIVEPLSITDYKPYLRPMSSMTEEEREEYHKLCDSYCDVYHNNIVSNIYFDTVVSIDWLNSHHFDYRGLIEKGLAIETPNNMYKI